jgi:ankyrin repeat protein
MLGGPPPVRSNVLEELVRGGPAALPHLIAHLDDRRTTRVVISHGGFLGGMFLNDSADFNARTQEARLPQEEQSDPLASLVGRKGGNRHTVTVGDLCFVALGQIVNREFSAVRYQPTAIIIVSSPTASPDLLAQLVRDWKGATELDLAASLVNDFLKPDEEDRRIGAAWRLAYYYPEYLEPLALAFLAQRTYPRYEVRDFVHEQLYTTRDAGRRRVLLEEFVKQHGEAAREGILLQLFEDLDKAEQARTLLVELFGKDPKVRKSDRPRYPEVVSDFEKARFIKEALIYDQSQKLDQAILRLLRSCGEDDFLAEACLARLVGRGYDADIERHCRDRLKLVPENWRKPYREILDKLGYTPLHVAVEQGRAGRVEELLRGGARPDAPARNGKTPLHLAAENGYVDLVQLLAAPGRGLDARDREGRTAVELAVEADADDVVRALVAAGCAVNDLRVAALGERPERADALLRDKRQAVSVTTGSKRTTLHLAAAWGNARTLAVLLRHKAEVDARDESETTPLHQAVAAGHAEAARMLLTHRANVRASLPESGLEPIHLAVLGNHRATIEVLLAHKADLNARQAQGQTPLHLAVQENQGEMLTFLLEKGAAVNVPNREGATPLHLAVLAGKLDLVRALLRHRADLNQPMGENGSPAIHVASGCGTDTLVELLLRSGAGVDARGAGGITPLHTAALAGNEPVVRLLLGRKATVDAAMTTNRSTPLHHAVQAGQAGVVAMLLRGGANARAVTREGRQPLHEACAVSVWAPEASLAMARRLLDHEADPNARTKEGDTPLHIAAASGGRKLVEVLLARGAAVDARNHRGETPLHSVIRFTTNSVRRVYLAPNATYVVSLLLEHKANVNAKDGNGATPLHRAARGNDTDLIRLLLSRKADPSARDGDGHTPLEIAVAEENPRVAELLRRYTPGK